MSFRTRLLSLGMESEGAEGEAALVTEDTGAQELLEVNEVAGEIEATETVIDELHDSGDQLEEVAAAMESMIQDGRGMSADAARFAQLAVTGAVSKFGIAAPMPSMESFVAGQSGQLRQTQISLEGVKDAILKVWNWIKAQFAKLRVHIKDFWLKTFDGAARLKKRAESMMKKAESVSGSAKEAQVTVSADLVGKLHVGGKMPTDMAAAVGEYKKVSDAMLGKVTEEIVKAAEDACTAIKGISFDATDKLNEGIVKYLGARAKVSQAGKIVAVHDASGEKAHQWTKAEGMTAARTDELLGGSAVYFFSSSKDAGSVSVDGLKNDTKTNGKVLGVAEKAPETKEAKVATLSGGNVAKICDEVMGIAATVESFKRNFEAQEKVKDSFTAAGKHVEGEAAKADKLDADGQKLASAFVRAINSVPQMIDQPSQKFAQYTVSTLNAVLNYCDLSLSQYK